MGDKALMQGTLDMLILKTLTRGVMHGYAIVEFIQQGPTTSCAWRKARSIPRFTASNCAACSPPNGAFRTTTAAPNIYKLTAAGRKHLAEESASWNRLSGAVARIMQTA